MITATMLGHECYWDVAAQFWRWMDNHEPTGWGVGIRRECVRCGQFPAANGHDACLGYIKGAIAACCGHGIEDGSIKYANGDTTIIPKANSY